MARENNIITQKPNSGLYEDLPKNSMAKNADNSLIFEQFKSRIGTFGNLEYAILCKDRDNKYTWHIHCDEYTLNDIRTKWARECSLEPRIKKLRHGRYLECMEADCNKDATFNICLTVDRDTK